MIPASLARFDTPLTPQERTELVSELSVAIRKRGMETPVYFLLETHRPLGFILSQSVVALTPMLAPLLGLERMEKAVRLLGDPVALDALLQNLSFDADSDTDRQEVKRNDSDPPSLCASMRHESSHSDKGDATQ